MAKKEAEARWNKEADALARKYNKNVTDPITRATNEIKARDKVYQKYSKALNGTKPKPKKTGKGKTGNSGK